MYQRFQVHMEWGQSGYSGAEENFMNYVEGEGTLVCDFTQMMHEIFIHQTIHDVLCGYNMVGLVSSII